MLKSLIIIYSVMVLSLITAIAITKKLPGNAYKLAVKRTVFVVLLIGMIYLIHIIGMIICAINKELLMLLNVGISMLLATIPVTCLIIIPLCNKMHLRDIEKEYGENSYYAKYLREKTKKHKKTV